MKFNAFRLWFSGVVAVFAIAGACTAHYFDAVGYGALAFGLASAAYSELKEHCELTYAN